MNAQKRFIAFDLGASSGRGVVGSLDNGTLRIDELHRFPNGPTTILGSMYWDVLRLFGEMLDALCLYTKTYGKELQGIGFDTWGVDYGLLAKDGSLLGNPVHYRDPRTDGMMERVCERVSRQEIFEATGIQFMQLNTLFQLYAMVAQQSPLLDAADTLLLMPSLFLYFFTGRKVNEFTHATTTQIYDPRAGDWAYDLLQKLGIPTGMLGAEIVSPGTVVGDILPQIAKDTSLGKVPILASACHDTASAVAAVPAQAKDWAYLSSGTWSLLGVEVAEPIINADSLRYNLTNEGGVGNTYRFLKNIMGLWLVQECKRIWEREGTPLDYAELMHAAEHAPPFKAIIDPNDNRFLKPPDMPEAIVQFCQHSGQQPPSTHGEFVRCALESLALKYRNVLEKFEHLRGKPVDVLHIVGGGVQNTLLCQFAANATGKPVIAGPTEATAIGNIMMQAIATGDIASIAEGREIVKHSFDVTTYEPQNTAQWEEVYHRSRELLEQSW
ncbi:rhamnulokinase [candidate division KSB3 bacterium]|uniref:Rhamnulokinase n=1 Tax=candidate division KSB3 bacterium TaxID=2044937 RepID=A0A9D5JYP0_9BACT|nr:rhamnulokinase [candidate division KSB3 bacterium]MBD3326648.1 rhamnulokinase [candidate division KSB3 bacterium]